jgi:hypothetical protein
MAKQPDSALQKIINASLEPAKTASVQPRNPQDVPRE